VLAKDGCVTLVVPRLPDDMSGETLVTVAKRRPEGAWGMLARWPAAARRRRPFISN